MGTWYVVGYTPLVVDKGAHNAVEHYAQDDRGRIQTTYQFRKGGVDGPVKTYTPTGFVGEVGNGAVWRMQFVWPFKAAYVVVYVSDDYSHTLIGHPNRKYAWIMQRSPQVDPDVYESLLDRLEEAGFDRERIVEVPHDWANEGERLRRIQAVGAAEPLAPR